MNQEQVKRAKNSILGALVADAATMGLHWLYSQKRISEVVPDQPEFRDPNPEDFRGNVGYFAHSQKKAGELSHYGEQCLVMLRSLAARHGVFDRQHYQEQFRTHFGYGGEFVGYIDRPTRETLDTIYRLESDALEKANSISYSGEAKERQGILTKVLAAAKRYQGERLLEEAKNFIRSTSHPEEALLYIQGLIKALDNDESYPGAIDEQLPAISKLPALVACHADDSALPELALAAIKVTNNAPRAIDFGNVCTQVLKVLVKGESIEKAIGEGIAAASGDTRELLTDIMALDETVPEMTSRYGLHCDLGAGVPSLIYNLKSATSYVEAVRRNIYAGGDNCGRSIVLGAACGAMFGVGGDQGIPLEWIQKLHNRDAIQQDIEQLFSG